MVSHQRRGINTRHKETDRNDPTVESCSSWQQMLTAQTNTEIACGVWGPAIGLPLCSHAKTPPLPPGDLKPAETEKQGKGLVDAQARCSAVCFKRSERWGTQIAEQCRRQIHSSQGEKLVRLLKDDYLEDVCALLGDDGKNV